MDSLCLYLCTELSAFVSSLNINMSHSSGNHWSVSQLVGRILKPPFRTNTRCFLYLVQLLYCEYSELIHELMKAQTERETVLFCGGWGVWLETLWPGTVCFCIVNQRFGRHCVTVWGWSQHIYTWILWNSPFQLSSTDIVIIFFLNKNVYWCLSGLFVFLNRII